MQFLFHPKFRVGLGYRALAIQRISRLKVFGVGAGMKCNPLRWVWGLLPVLGLTWLAAQLEHASIEGDLTRRVEDQLKGTGLRWAKTGFAGRDGVLFGDATDEDEPLKAIGMIRDTWGVRVVENQTKLIEKANNFSWSAARSARRIELRGMVPNENSRQSIVELAKSTFPGMDVNDVMQIRRGVPSQDTWLSGVSFGLKQLKSLKAGEARMDGLGLAVSGEAESQDSYRSVKTALASQMPRGVRLTDDKITAPVIKPYVWTVKQSGNQLILTGYVPSDRVRSEITAAAKTSFPQGTLVDRMESGDGAPLGFITAVAASLRELSRLEDGSADARDSMLTVSGMAADDAAADQIRRAIRSGIPQTFRFTDQIKVRAVAIVPPQPVVPPSVVETKPSPAQMQAPLPPLPRTASPYVTTAEVDAGRVILTGFVPSPAARDLIDQAARARFTGRSIENRLDVAAGAPEGWQRCFESGLLGVARIGNGRVTITDRKLDVTGTADDDEVVDAVPTEIRAAVQGICDPSVRVGILPEPNLNWRAVRSGSSVVLSGEVPSAAVRIALVQQSSRLMTSASIVDNMQVVEGRSRKWPKAAETGLTILAQLQSGQASLSRQRLTVTGEAREQTTIVNARDRLVREMPRGYDGSEQISLVQRPQPPATASKPPVPNLPPPVAVLDPRAKACQDGLQTAAREGIIRFERAQAELTRESTATLNKLAQIARDCPKVKIEIEGHTDAEGTPERNQRLSDRRAQAIVDYLTRAGVEPGKLQAIGYGETRPIAPNDSPENRARNRRIEFNVRE
jgi:outer membrane protein OmpA-like peptidoglycan-associated protein